MRFLEKALGAIQNGVPKEARSYFQAPKVGVLGANLDALHKGYFRFLREELASLLDERGH